MRRRASAVRSRLSILTILKEDLQFEDPSRTIARGVKAIVGAVHYDGGIGEVRLIMKELGIGGDLWD
jgi:hypothetical protein